VPASPSFLICFAVKHEAHPFLSWAHSHPSCQVLLTGMGRENARAALDQALSQSPYRLVLSCGFAGGLHPQFERNRLIYAADESFPWIPALQAAGARPAHFLCADQIAARAADKLRLRHATGADAVEMESETIQTICRQHDIPCATFRVVLDTAQEDLPLDFNESMTPEHKIAYSRIAWSVLKAPHQWKPLLAFQQQCQAAAQSLARGLQTALPQIGPG
jgi:adenosylhomocysteine nucleosidase